jgi:hypothetical protein
MDGLQRRRSAYASGSTADMCCGSIIRAARTSKSPLQAQWRRVHADCSNPTQLDSKLPHSERQLRFRILNPIGCVRRGAAGRTREEIVFVDKYRVASTRPAYSTTNGSHRESIPQFTHNFGLGAVVCADFRVVAGARFMLLDHAGDRGKFVQNSRAVESETITGNRRTDTGTP